MTATERWDFDPDDVRIEVLPEDRWAELFALYRRYLGTGDRVVELFEWRTENAEASGGIEPRAPLLDGRILGAMSTIPITLMVDGRPVRAAWHADSIVAREARGRGLGKRLLVAAADEYEVLMAKGTSAAMYPLRKAVGYVDVPGAANLLLPLAPWPRTGRRARVLLTLRWLRGLVRSRRRERSVSVREVEGFPPAVEEAVDAMDSSESIFVRKSVPFLNWRYTRAPGRRYRILAAGGGARGAVVVRPPADAGGDGQIVDLLCAVDDPAAGRSLVTAAVDLLDSLGAGFVSTFATSPVKKAWLSEVGFYDTGRSTRFTFRTENPALRESLQVPRWDVWTGDADGELFG